MSVVLLTLGGSGCAAEPESLEAHVRVIREVGATGPDVIHVTVGVSGVRGISEARMVCASREMTSSPAGSTGPNADTSGLWRTSIPVDMLSGGDLEIRFELPDRVARTVVRAPTALEITPPRDSTLAPGPQLSFSWAPPVTGALYTLFELTAPCAKFSEVSKGDSGGAFGFTSSSPPTSGSCAATLAMNVVGPVATTNDGFATVRAFSGYHTALPYRLVLPAR